MTRVHDVVVIGAGPGGSSAAHYLAGSGLDVLLLDKSDFPRDKTCGDGLTPRAVRALDDLRLLDDLRAVGYRANQLDVFAPNGDRVGAELPRRDGLPDYSLVVPRLVLDDAVRRRALANGAEFRGQAHVTGIESAPDGVTVRSQRHGRAESIRARTAVVATGASPRLLLQTGVLSKTPPLMLASRAYFEGVDGLNGRLQMRFDGVPLPGYGWAFPLSESSANVGAGFFRAGWAARRMPASSRGAFDGFVGWPPVRAMLARARCAGPVKGFPLRVDFATAPTFGPRLLLVGEAARLVNPLTGEGIDYALESGRIAAEHLAGMFAADDFSERAHRAYDRRLRQRFQRLFVFCGRMRDLYVNRAFLNPLVRAAKRRPDLKDLLVNIALGNQDAREGVS